MWETQIAKVYASARVQVGPMLRTKYFGNFLSLFFQTIYGGTNEIMKELIARSIVKEEK